MGGRSRSRSNTTTNNVTQDFTTNTTDNRLLEGDNGIIGGNINFNAGETGDDINLRITQTDLGAIDAARDISESSLGFAGAAGEAAVSAINSGVGQAVALASESTQRAIDVAKEATQDEAARTQQLLIIGGVAVAVAVVFFARKRK